VQSAHFGLRLLKGKMRFNLRALVVLLLTNLAQRKAESVVSVWTFPDLVTQTGNKSVSAIRIVGHIIFLHPIDIAGRTLLLFSNESAVLDGQATTCLFNISASNVSFHDLGLRNGSSSSRGGCVRAKSSTVVLANVSLESCMVCDVPMDLVEAPSLNHISSSL
jgi:hypothetical protein